MESNKDEAYRALDLAISAESSGDFEKAAKLYQKSINLYPTEKAKYKLSHLKDKSQNPSKKSENNYDNRSNSSQNHVKKEENVRPNPKKEEEKREYTADQKKLVDQILACKDYYQILGCEKNSSKEEVSKKYKKLALRLHPDKNGAPGAEDAFKKVSQAFVILNDPQKRKSYDVRGFDAESTTDAPPSFHRGYSSSGMDGMTPEELFEAFFGGRAMRTGGFTYSTNGNNVFRQRREGPNRARHERARVDEEQSFFVTILQFLPIILLFLFAVLGGGKNLPQQ
eukprot:TRINITY_DN3350_c0_g1_i1.p1 TRINITY_DN3350_c0_g1~~TRINITY_DN3350_c0_g1_i1.p1  ORF type:complete len:282 (+),score=104.59 TRINITY_DN3350_c0_g1_i1:53-898(+)